jgi:hypothetical protein
VAAINDPANPRRKNCSPAAAAGGEPRAARQHATVRAHRATHAARTRRCANCWQASADQQRRVRGARLQCVRCQPQCRCRYAASARVRVRSRCGKPSDARIQAKGLTKTVQQRTPASRSIRQGAMSRVPVRCVSARRARGSRGGSIENGSVQHRERHVPSIVKVISRPERCDARACVICGEVIDGR